MIWQEIKFPTLGRRRLLIKKWNAIMTFLVVLVLLIGGGIYHHVIAQENEDEGFAKKVVYSMSPKKLKGYLCRPSGAGPFPAVLYNHGGLGNIIGGAPEKTCKALAEAGFVGFSPIRRQTRPLAGHPDDIQAGLNYLLGLDYVNRSRLGMAGFSRGGALTFMVAAREASIKAVIVMASAHPPHGSGFTLEDAVRIKAPVLLLVAENDTGSKKSMGQNTLDTMHRMSAALTDAGNSPELIVYPPYGFDGHEMFFEIGDYWKDIIMFLKKQL